MKMKILTINGFNYYKNGDIKMKTFKLFALVALVTTSAFSQEPVKEVYGIRNCDIFVEDSTLGFNQVSEILSEKGFTVITERTYPNFWETDFMFSHQIHFSSWTSHTPDFINVSLGKVVHHPGGKYEFDGYDLVVSFKDVPYKIRSNKPKILKATRKFPKCLLTKTKDN